MSDQDQQTVAAEVEAEAKPSVETEGAQGKPEPSLDDLLKEFDSEVKPAAQTETPEKATGDDDKLSKIERELAAIKRSDEERVFRADMNTAVSKVKGDLEVSETLVEAWINAEATKDSRLSKAWLERHNNPRQYEKVLDGLSHKLAKELAPKTDRAATEDREAVAAAVKGTAGKSQEAPPPDYSRVSNNEFRDDVRKKYGFNPPV